MLELVLAVAKAAASSGGSSAHVCTCACCESCLYPAEDVGSFGIDDCVQCTEERCRSVLPMPTGGCPASGGSVNATCTAATDTPYATVADYMDDSCETGTGEPEATYIVGKCYTMIDIGLSKRIDCSGSAAATTSWFGQPGGVGPFCPQDQGTGPLRLGTPDGTCVEGTPGMGYYRVMYSGSGGVCPGETPPHCGFNASSGHPGLGHCEGSCPELSDCGCGLLQGYCTSNLDANCQIPKCCNCCSWPCQLTPDPEACCAQFPACCL